MRLTNEVESGLIFNHEGEKGKKTCVPRDWYF